MMVEGNSMKACLDSGVSTEASPNPCFSGGYGLCSIELSKGVTTSALRISNDL